MAHSTVIIGDQKYRLETLSGTGIAVIDSTSLSEEQEIAVDGTCIIGENSQITNGVSYMSVNLPDGTQAFLVEDVKEEQEEELETQTVTLEEGNTLFIQEFSELPRLLQAQTIKLDDGVSAVLPDKDFQPVLLEDGSTAFISLSSGLLDSLELHPLATQEEITEESTNVEKSEEKTKLCLRNLAKTFMCSHNGCGKFYTTLHHLKVHERAHTGDRPFRCTESGCDKSFTTGYGRKAHVRTHTGEKPYKCPEDSCGKAFKTSGDLQKHIRIHTGERPFRCPIPGCDRSFTTSNIRKVHVRTHTGERPYVCPHEGCKRAFASATNYKNHLRIHSGEKPYICSIQGCGKRFTEYSSLYKHHMVHTQMKPYSCSVCGRQYRQVSTLTMHKRTAHGIVEADDGTQIVLGETVFALANSGTRKKVKTVSTDLLELNKDGETLIALQASSSCGSLESLENSEGQFLLVTDSSQLTELEQIAVTTAEGTDTEERLEVKREDQREISTNNLKIKL